MIYMKWISNFSNKSLTGKIIVIVITKLVKILYTVGNINLKILGVWYTRNFLIPLRKKRVELRIYIILKKAREKRQKRLGVINNAK